MIQAEGDAQRREEYLQKLMQPPNAVSGSRRTHAGAQGFRCYLGEELWSEAQTLSRQACSPLILALILPSCARSMCRLRGEVLLDALYALVGSHCEVSAVPHGESPLQSWRAESAALAHQHLRLTHLTRCPLCLRRLVCTAITCNGDSPSRRIRLHLHACVCAALLPALSCTATHLP